MSKFVLGFTNRKGCSICGRDLFKVNSGQVLILDGSKGKVAVCSPSCAEKYKPHNEDAPATTADVTPPAGGANPVEKKKKIKAK